MNDVVFVFGSNLGGRHGKGAALAALRNHGAIYGQAEGLMGRSYALPTCDRRFNGLNRETIKFYVDRFLHFTHERQDLGFQVTRVGCGLAGLSDAQIAPLFNEAPAANVFFDTAWRPYLKEGFEYWGHY